MLLNSIIRALTLAQLKEVVCAYSSEMASASGYRESLSKGCHDVSDIGTSRHAIQSQNLNKLKVLFLGIFLKFVLNLLCACGSFHQVVAEGQPSLGILGPW